MTRFLLVASALVAFVFAGCSTAVSPGVTNVAVSSAEAKYGESTCRWIIGIRVNSCSVDAAIKKAGITQVQTINIDGFSLFIYQSQTISARGK